ncbi:unannotated protein [freshwater metagenome]|uniref:Unannotated protein n=1 Tax=freshwater metagenome TaxID=449393 RepID=A0A6J7HPT4_9ZZZZ
MNFQCRTRRRDGRAHLQHVCTEDLLLTGDEVVGVVLHEGRTALQSLGHHLHAAQQHRRLPVALAAEAVTVGHQSLHRQSRQLTQPAEVLEVGGERLEPAVGEELPHSRFDACAVAEGVVTIPVLVEARCDVVERPILVDEFRDGRLADAVDNVHEIVDAVGVHGDAEAQLCLYLVALGDRDVAHVVAEAGQFQRTQFGPAECRARPLLRPRPYRRIVDVARDGGAQYADPGLDVPELAITVRSLVQIHELHVDRGPGQRHSGLRVQVQQWNIERVQACDPHLGRRESVHPGDDADAVLGGVGLAHAPQDRGRVEQHRLPDDGYRQCAVEFVCDLP